MLVDMLLCRERVQYHVLIRVYFKNVRSQCMLCCEEGKICLMFRCVAGSTVNHIQHRLKNVIWRSLLVP